MAAALQANEALLKELPPPLVALEYYRGGDLYLFDDFQTSNRREPRRPDCKYGCCTKLPASHVEPLRTVCVPCRYRWGRVPGAHAWQRC